MAEDEGSPRGARAILMNLARAAQGGLVTTARAAEVLEISSPKASLVLTRLVARGWLARVRRGLYLVLPLESKREGAIVEDPWLLAHELFRPCYIGGWSAAEHWALTEQLFRSVFVATAATIRHGAATHLGSEFRIVRVSPDKVESVTSIWRGSARIAVSDRERTIADALVAPSWIGGIRHLADILVAYHDSDRWNEELLLAQLSLVGSGAAYKRLGYLSEKLLGGAEAHLISVARERRTAGLVKLDPSVGDRGRADTRWGLWVNVNVAGEVNT